ncbi:hypothetical protein VB740_14840, partial [Nostoc sp. UHCC 0251]|nr:hypothetical protein [Nostoc sp. UHCC 0251]
LDVFTAGYEFTANESHHPTPYTPHPVFCNAGKAQEVVAEIEKLGVEAIAVQADISKISDIQRLFEQTLEGKTSV